MILTLKCSHFLYCNLEIFVRFFLLLRPGFSLERYSHQFVTQIANSWVLDFPKLPSYFEKPTWKIKGRDDTSLPTSHSRFSRDLTSSVIDWRRAEFAPSGNTCGGYTRAWAAILQPEDVHLLLFFPLASPLIVIRRTLWPTLDQGECDSRRSGTRADHYRRQGLKAEAYFKEDSCLRGDP